MKSNGKRNVQTLFSHLLKASVSEVQSCRATANITNEAMSRKRNLAESTLDLLAKLS